LTAIAPSSSQGTIVGCVFMGFSFCRHCGHCPLLSLSLWLPSSPLLPSSSRSSPFVGIVVAVLTFVAIVVTVLPVVSIVVTVLTFVAIICCTPSCRRHRCCGPPLHLHRCRGPFFNDQKRKLCPFFTMNATQWSLILRSLAKHLRSWKVYVTIQFFFVSMRI